MIFTMLRIEKLNILYKNFVCPHFINIFHIIENIRGLSEKFVDTYD